MSGVLVGSVHDTFEPDIELLKSSNGQVPREEMARVRPGVAHFVYRRAPERLIAKRIGDTLEHISEGVKERG